MKKLFLFIALIVSFVGCKKESATPKPAPSILGNWNVTESSVLPTTKNIVGIVSIDLDISSFVFNNDGTAQENFMSNGQLTYIYMLSNFKGINYINFIQTPGTIIYNDGYSLNNETFTINYNLSPNSNSISLTRVGPISSDLVNYETVIDLIK